MSIIIISMVIHILSLKKWFDNCAKYNLTDKTHTTLKKTTHKIQALKRLTTNKIQVLGLLIRNKP